MKFNVLAISTLLALAAAETTTAQTATVTLTPEQSCANKCKIPLPRILTCLV
jgi:hypothetical protein